MALYSEENRKQRQRLLALLERLSDAQLAAELPNGWRVADALAHLAFWDRYALHALQEWQHSGFKMPGENWVVINAVVESMSRTIPFSALRAWVRESAEQCDHCVEQLPETLVKAIEAGKKENFLFRATHRRHHLDQIEKLSESQC